MMPRLVSSIVVSACVISASTPASEKRPRLARADALLLVEGRQQRAQRRDCSRPFPRPSRPAGSENSSFEPREKNTLDGIVSTLVGMPLRVRNCATACAIASSLM